MHKRQRDIFGGILQANQVKEGHVVDLDEVNEGLRGVIFRVGEVDLEQEEAEIIFDDGSMDDWSFDTLVPVPSAEGSYWVLELNAAYSDGKKAQLLNLEKVRQDGTPVTERRSLHIRELWKSGLNRMLNRDDLHREYYDQIVLEEQADGTWLIHVREE